jgi:hypothetical protein
MASGTAPLDGDGWKASGSFEMVDLPSGEGGPKVPGGFSRLRQWDSEVEEEDDFSGEDEDEDDEGGIRSNKIAEFAPSTHPAFCDGIAKQFCEFAIRTAARGDREKTERWQEQWRLFKVSAGKSELAVVVGLAWPTVVSNLINFLLSFINLLFVVPSPPARRQFHG